MACDRHQKSNVSSVSTNRWRRYTPCLLVLVIMLTAQFLIITSKISIMKFYNIGNSWSKIEKIRTGPQHILLLSYARTGSSFVGDLLQCLPKSFYQFEPVHFLSNSVLNGSFDDARTLLNNLFTCNISKIPGYVNWVRDHPRYMKFKRSNRYWKVCSTSKACFNSSFVQAFCRNQSTVIMKTIRINLREASLLFTTYPNLNLKIIYLMRDPRGTLNSRAKLPVRQWCKKDPVCSDPKQFCAALGNDLHTMCELLSTRPEDFTVIRYEDLAMNPGAVVDHLVQFLKVSSEVSPEMYSFLRTHTSVLGNIREKVRRVGLDYAYSTFRNSSITATKWRQEMNFSQLMELQRDCQQVLSGLGYHTYNTITALRSINVNFDANLLNSLRQTCALS